MRKRLKWSCCLSSRWVWLSFGSFFRASTRGIGFFATCCLLCFFVGVGPGVRCRGVIIDGEGDECCRMIHMRISYF